MLFKRIPTVPQILVIVLVEFASGINLYDKKIQMVPSKKIIVIHVHYRKYISLAKFFALY